MLLLLHLKGAGSDWPSFTPLTITELGPFGSEAYAVVAIFFGLLPFSHTIDHTQVSKCLKTWGRNTGKSIILKIFLLLEISFAGGQRKLLVFAGSLGNILGLVGGPVTGLFPSPSCMPWLKWMKTGADHLGQ